MQEFYRLMQEILATDEEEDQSTTEAIDYLWALAEHEAGPDKAIGADVLAKVCIVQFTRCQSDNMIHEY
jgi:hypothetical protein